MNGAGSATMSAGTATGCGTGAATQGSPINFTVSAAGTCTVTVSGSLNAFQLENGAAGTPLIVTAGATASRDWDRVTLKTAPSFAQSTPAYTALINATPLMPVSYGTVQTPLQIDDGTNNNRIDIDRQASSGQLCGPGAPPCANWTTGAAWNVVYALTNGPSAMTATGGYLSLGSFSQGWTPARVILGSNGNFVHNFDGTMARFALWPTTRLPYSIMTQMAQ